MCYPFPGPRCSAHTRDVLRVAKSAYEATPTEEGLEDYRKAKFAYQQSPAGIKDLREQASDAIARKDYDAAIEYTKLADVNERSRASSVVLAAKDDRRRRGRERGRGQPFVSLSSATRGGARLRSRRSASTAERCDKAPPVGVGGRTASERGAASGGAGRVGAARTAGRGDAAVLGDAGREEGV